MSVAKTQKLRVHPFNVFQGADSKPKCVITTADTTVSILTVVPIIEQMIAVRFARLDLLAV